MSKKRFLENIEVNSPCSENWGEMSGNDKVRFCSHCSKSVNNLSAMTRKQAVKVVRQSNGEICARYVKNPFNNKPVFADKIYQITRRAGITAGVLGASLSLSTLNYAQGGISIVLKIEKTKISERNDLEGKKTASALTSISGIITDPNGTVIPNVSISLINKDNIIAGATLSNEEGFYEIKNIQAGTYMLKAEVVGFQLYQVDDLVIGEDEDNKRDIQMDAGEQYVTMGIVAVIEYENPLHRAVANDDLEEVKNLLARGAEGVNSKDKNYYNITPLFLAVENGNLEITQTLLDFGAKIKARNNNKQTPLMLLDEDASPDLVRLLIRYGAKVNSTDAQGNTALIFAARSVKPEVLQLLLIHSANIDTQNKAGQTALMNAVDEGNLENVKALLEAGANVNFKNKDGETALDLASDEEIGKLLESYGALADEEK
jgi:hypothetical protein